MHPDKFYVEWKRRNNLSRKDFLWIKYEEPDIWCCDKSHKTFVPTYHESTFVKALADLDFPKDLVKNMKHLQMIEVYKNKKTTNNDLRRGIEEEKMVVLNLSTSLVVFSYIALFFFYSHLYFRLQ